MKMALKTLLLETMALLPVPTSNCAVSGGGSEIGGLVGENDGDIEMSYATGVVTLTVSGGGGIDYLANNQGIGGLVGWNGAANEGIITNSYATGAVSGGSGESSDAVGGLVGYNDSSANGTITSSYATGAVSGYNDVGGLVGVNSYTITNAYAIGAVSGSNRIGGLVGQNSNGTIKNSYAIGAVSGGSDVGGLVGLNFLCIPGFAQCITGGDSSPDSYWNIGTSGLTVSEGGTGELDSAMMQQATFQPGGGSGPDDWDFTNTWEMCGSYPVLLNVTQGPCTSRLTHL